MKCYAKFVLIGIVMFGNASYLGQISKNIRFLDSWFQDSLITSSSNKVRFSDCYGFTKNNKEFAVIGSTEGSHFFEISLDQKLIPKGTIQGKYRSAQVIHRDYAIYKDYMYAVCDEGPSSLQIIDISNVSNGVSIVKEDSVNFGQVHNVFIDTVNALLYCCIFTPYLSNPGQIYSPMKVYSLANPLVPVEVYDGPSDIDEVHDIYVRDGKSFLNCGFQGLRVYDFSNPSSPIFKSSLNIYQDDGYNHQGWLSPDGLNYFFADETNGKRIKRCEVENWDLTIKSYFGTNYLNQSVPHNMMCSNDFLFVAYYNEGLRIYDIRDSKTEEVAFYDTYTQESNNKLNGAWGVFSDFKSNHILVSDRQNGLFLLEFNRNIYLNANDQNVQTYPNPAVNGQNLIIKLNKNHSGQFKISFFNTLGQKIRVVENIDDFLETKLDFGAGMYFLEIEYLDDQKKVQLICEKLIVKLS